jgi:hypothetical protein
MKGNLESKVVNTSVDVVCDFAELVQYKSKVYKCQYKKDCMLQSHYGHSVSYCEKELNREDKKC